MPPTSPRPHTQELLKILSVGAGGSGAGDGLKALADEAGAESEAGPARGGKGGNGTSAGGTVVGVPMPERLVRRLREAQVTWHEKFLFNYYFEV